MPEAAKDDDAADLARVRYYVRFLRAGGTFSLGEWRGILVDADRDAAAVAGDMVARERAEALAEILQRPAPPTHAVRVLEALDQAPLSALRAAAK